MATFRRKLAWALGGLLTVLALLAVLFAVFMARRWSGFHKELDSELAEIRDSGHRSARKTARNSIFAVAGSWVRSESRACRDR